MAFDEHGERLVLHDVIFLMWEERRMAILKVEISDETNAVFR